MAFPAVGATATTDGTTASATATVNLPSGILVNDLLLVCLRTATSTAGHGYPVGWTELFDDNSDASDDRISLAYRWAAGTEGSTIGVSQDNQKYAALAWRITGAQNPATTAPQFATLAVGTSTTPNPGAVTPSGGTQDYLFLWLGGWEGEQTSPPASNPTNYASNVIGANSGTAGVVATNVRLASASRQLNTGAAEDPGTWTISASDDWTATTVCIHPATAAANLPPFGGLPPISPDWGY